jgi:predicted RNA methylase
MSQRASGYERIPADRYESPHWVVDCLVKHFPLRNPVWDPACGNEHMVKALSSHGLWVTGSDLYPASSHVAERDFLTMAIESSEGAIVTNPPFGKQCKTATAFIERALALMQPTRGQVAMLLPADFDHAKTRQHLFAEHSAYCGTIKLTKRVSWIHGPEGKPIGSGSPSTNSAWFLWDWCNRNPPIVRYAG